MTKEELKQHCEKQVKACEMWAENRGQEPSGKVYEEHKLILDLINELQDKSYELWKESYEVEHARNIQLEEKIKLLEQQPCDDCVSRQAVDLLCFRYLKPNNDDNIAFYEHFRALPLVTSTHKSGLRWIERFDNKDKWLECPYCHIDSAEAYNYCPNCGASFKEEKRGNENGSD